MEISEELGTTISFISQQLKLLEAAGLVKKKRTGSVERGKPRTIFSLAKESIYLIPLGKGIKEKKLIPLSKEHKIILKIWLIEDARLHNPLEKFFWKIEPYLDSIDSIILYLKKISPKAYIISQDPSLTHKLNEAQKKEDEKIDFSVVSSASPISKLESEYLVSIYNPEENFGDGHELKGGMKNK